MASLPVSETAADNPTPPKPQPDAPCLGEYMSQVLRLASAYKATGSVENICHLKYIAQKSLGQGHIGRRLRSENERIIEHLMVIEHETYYYPEEAKEASAACKALFFANSQDDAARVLKPEYLLVLAEGLRSMKVAVMVEPKLYRPFIMEFCRRAAKTKLKVDIIWARQRIRGVHAYVKCLVGEEGARTSLPILPDLTNPAAAVTEIINSDIKKCEEIETAMKIVQEAGLKELEGILGSGPSRGEPDLRAAIKNAAQADGSDEIKKAIEEIVRSLYLNFDLKIEKLRRLIQVKGEQTRSILDGMNQHDTQAEDGGDISTKNDEEEECDQ
ncbi:hypothetical protein NPX13_g7596 [Xylaria arbuscula]|uniref:Uncharacterized protein n=1 Tax=Xylaria arbuscula TaxID=114810 RepID=A0A9W8TJB8_9PEZI|nr:hypothetical protein NPX13_g7596 [Xylaria arbuscula]